MSTRGEVTRHSTRTDRAAGWLTRRFLLLLVVAAGLGGLSVLMMELQASSIAWIAGEGAWSKGQQQAVHALYRYAQHGRPEDLADAHYALQAPLGDRVGRLALEQDPPDLEVARQGFLEGGNHPGDIPRLISSFRYAHNWPYFRDAVQLWRQGEVDILQLQTMAYELEAAYRRGPLPAEQVEQFQQRLQVLDNELRVLELAFSQSLLDGARAARQATLLLSAVSLTALTLLSVLLIRRIRNHLAQNESRFRAAFHQASVGMMKIADDGRVLEANQALATILGHPLVTLRTLALADLLHPDDLSRGDQGIDWPAQLAAGERRFRRADGSILWGRWSASTVTAGDSDVRVLAIVEDVSKAHVLAEEVAYHASHDALTGLINRREIEHRLQQALQRSRKEAARHVLCLLDLDHFKLVNDTFGHAAGDAFLCRFTAAVQAQLRVGDWLGRYGGDEFVLLLPDTTLEQAREVLQRIDDALQQGPFGDAQAAPGVGCSIGVVEINADVADLNWLMRACDNACYAAKQAGRNRVHYFRGNDPLLERQHEGRWLDNVRRAITEDRLVLFAQKIRCLDDPQAMACEILLRLRDDTGQLRSPAEFLPVVERYGMGTSVDRHVLSCVLKELRQAPRKLVRLQRCNVNLSALSVGQAEFLDFVMAELSSEPELARRICFEITETSAVGNFAQARRFIAAVRELGCHIALDDFGNGLSSLSFLRQLSPDVLKIDGSFVLDLDTNEVSRATVRAIVGLARDLGHAGGGRVGGARDPDRAAVPDGRGRAAGTRHPRAVPAGRLAGRGRQDTCGVNGNCAGNTGWCAHTTGGDGDRG